MSVFTRLSDIINSNLNAMLDEAEDPEKMVRMITHEMEETLVEVRSTSARYIADRKAVAARILRLRSEANGWDQKAELAVNKGRDDLARSALKEKARLDEAAVLLEADLEHIDAAIEKLKLDTSQLEDKLRMAHARQKALILRGKTAKSRVMVKRQLNTPHYEDAMGRFELYERKLDEMEGEIESWDLGNRTLSEEISELVQDEQVDADLEALKRRLGHGSPITTEERSES